MSPDQKRADHRVEFTIEPEQVTGQIICESAPDADCRLYCPDPRGCEEYSIEHDTDGPFHTAFADDNEVRHPLAAGKHCGIKEWLEGDSVLVSYDGPAAPVVNGPIVTKWDGDVVTWAYPAAAPAPVACVNEAHHQRMFACQCGHRRDLPPGTEIVEVAEIEVSP